MWLDLLGLAMAVATGWIVLSALAEWGEERSGPC